MDEFDIIVVGGGSAGSAAAGRLSQDPRLKVCLVEAGGHNNITQILAPAMLGSIPAKSNWRFETVPQKGLNGRCGYQPRGRGLGGSSAINAMIYIRGAAWDYDNWARVGAEGWSYADVLPYFRRAEHNERGADEFHGAGGPLNVMDQSSPHQGSIDWVEAAASLQMPRNPDFNGAQIEGIGLYQVTQKGGERWSAARAYVEPAVSAGRLHVEQNALVERLEVTEGRVTGVIFRQGLFGARRTVRARAGVVLSAGAFGSPQILQLSGIGPAAHLHSLGIPVVLDRPGVGSDLQDHIDYVAGYETGGDLFHSMSLKGQWRGFKALMQWRKTRTGWLTSPLAEAGGFARTRPDVEVPDVQFHFVPAVLEDHGRTKVRVAGFSCHVCVLRPESRGTVRLASPRAKDAPLIDPAFLTDDRDMEVLKAGVRLMERICESEPLTRHGGRKRHSATDDAALEQLIRSRADTVYHPVGTCRMGNDADAVVDPALKAKGIDGLWVADASVMPRLVSGNTNAPSIMIGERAADFVAAALRG